MPDGSPGYFKDRYRPKRFRIWHWGPTGRRRSGKGSKDPGLYNVVAVLAAIKRGDEVWLDEGEKDANALIGLGVVATTAGGAGQLPPKARQLLRGASISVVLDNDKAGRAAQATMEDALSGVAARLRFYVPAAGKDAYDHVVTHGLTLQELVEVAPAKRVRAAPTGTPPRSAPSGSNSAEADDYKTAKLRELAGAPIGERNNRLNDISFNLLRLAHGGTYNVTATLAELTQVALNLSLPMTEIRSTLRSADSSASQSARTWFMAGRTDMENVFVAQAKEAVVGATWRGKGGRYRYRVILGLIEVLMTHPFSPGAFPASERDIAKACGAKDRYSLRRALAVLVADGWLTIVRMGDHRKATVWGLQIPGSVPNISDGSPTSVFPGSESGLYSEALPISHPAFLPSCLGFPAHQLLLHLSVHDPLTVLDLTRRTGQSPTTTRQALRRLDETGMAIFGTGWTVTKADIRRLADKAAEESGSRLEQARFHRRLDAQQRNYRAFLQWLDTPQRERPTRVVSPRVVLILQAA